MSPLVAKLLLDSKAVVLVLWMVADAKDRRRTPCFDYGYFLFILYPFSLFWYWTRALGWRGLGMSLGLLLMTLVPPIATGIIAFVAQNL